MNAISRAIEKLENATAPFWQWCAGFLGILFIRFFLESFSSPAQSFGTAPDGLTLVHYGLFYLAALLLTALVLRIAVPNISAILKFLIAIFPVLWLPPIIDLIASNGAGYQMAYIFTSGNALLSRFLTFGGSAALGGVTIGIKIEFVIILLGIFFYVFTKTKNAWKAIGMAVLTYAIMFSLIALPSFLAMVGGGSAPSVLSFLINTFSSSHMAGNFMRPTIQVSYQYAIETVFNLGMAQILYLFDFILAVLCLIVYRPLAAWTFLKNIRFGRLVHFLLMIILGALLAVTSEHASPFLNGVDAIAFAGLLLSFICAWLFEVGVNDEVDVAIDRISNADRPLVTGALSQSEMRAGMLFFLAWSLLGGYLSGYWAFFAVSAFLAVYYIYSAPPLRLKRIPLFATFFISLASLSAAIAGFYFASNSKLVSSFPMSIFALIIVCFTLLPTVKDIKDIEGDRAEGIWTIPTILGEGAGKQITGGLVVVAFFAVPVILRSQILFIPSFIAAVIGYWLVVTKKYREWRIFVLYFVYAAVAGALLWKF